MVRVDNLVVTLVLESRVWSRCALFPEQHFIRVGDIVGLAWANGKVRYFGGWLCSACLADLPPEPKGTSA